jgi:hypothetical protein
LSEVEEEYLGAVEEAISLVQWEDSHELSELKRAEVTAKSSRTNVIKA